MNNLEKYKMNKIQRLLSNFKDQICNFPHKIKNLFINQIPKYLKNKYQKILKFIKQNINNFIKGNFFTKLSYFVFGVNHLRYKQIGKGILYLIFQITFIIYMSFFGIKYLKLLPSLGTIQTSDNIWNEETGTYERIWGDNSMLILLYSVITIFIILLYIYFWYKNIEQSKLLNDYHQMNKQMPSFKDDVKNIIDKQYYKAILSIPSIGLILFTILPIIFMILVAFTNWDIKHYPPEKLFDWVGFDNFIDLFGGGTTADTKLFFNTFKHVLIWTLVWAVFATFTNYFLGMLVAMLINKKGIKLKKLWRTILVFTIAVPQFVSLLLISKMLADKGIINILLEKYHLINHYIPFLSDPTLAKITVIIVNIWIGIPYTMLITTGILMNVPKDLYEAAKIDGVSPFKMYTKITLPYTLFITGPYLVSTFIGNINNFNVIYLLTGGNPKNLNFQFAGDTDLLITWLYKLTLDNSNFKLASVIGIIVFLIIAFISLIFYSKTSAVKNEGDFK